MKLTTVKYSIAEVRHYCNNKTIAAMVYADDAYNPKIFNSIKDAEEYILNVDNYGEYTTTYYILTQADAEAIFVDRKLDSYNWKGFNCARMNGKDCSACDECIALMSKQDIQEVVNKSINKHLQKR